MRFLPSPGQDGQHLQTRLQGMLLASGAPRNCANHHLCRYTALGSASHAVSRSFALDFEQSPPTVLRAIFADVVVQFCLFHLNQNCYRQVQLKGLQALYNDPEHYELRKLLRCLPALAFLPVNDVESGLEEVVAAINAADIPQRYIVNVFGTQFSCRFLRLGWLFRVPRVFPTNVRVSFGGRPADSQRHLPAADVERPRRRT